MPFRNHRKKIKAYRASGKMFGQAFCTEAAHARCEEREALGKEYKALRLPGNWVGLTTHEIKTAVAAAKGR